MFRRSACARFSDGMSKSNSWPSRTSTASEPAIAAGFERRPGFPRLLAEACDFPICEQLIGHDWLTGSGRIACRTELNAALEPIDMPPFIRGVIWRPNWKLLRCGSQVNPRRREVIGPDPGEREHRTQVDRRRRSRTTRRRYHTTSG